MFLIVRFVLFSIGVAFAAKLRASRNYNFGATIVFDAPIANVGNRYNARNGIFTAAVDGTYFFSVVSRLP